IVLEHIVRNLTAERTPHRDLDGGMQAAIFAEHWQQVERGKFIGGDYQLALLQFAHFYQRHLRVLPQVEQLLRVFLQNASGVGQYPLARSTVAYRFSDLEFEFADGLADGGLGAKELFGGPGEAAFASDTEEDFELGKVHGCRSQVSGLA